MPLKELNFPITEYAIPGEISSYLREADLRIDRFRFENDLPGFVCSDFERVFQGLRTIDEENLSSGTCFCEWGSGFGVVAGMASMLEFSAYGIEIERELVDAASELSVDFELPVDFACGSFIPEGAGSLADSVNEFNWLVMGHGNGYEELDLGPEDFDLFFAYPWPGEDDLFRDIFDKFAASGALLMTYHGLDDLKLRRKV